MNSKRIVHYILVSASVIFMTIASGCILNPNPKTVWHDGVITNTGDRTLYIAFRNPDSEHANYANKQLLPARTGSATYWLHERSKSNPYLCDVFDIDNNLVRTLKISPDAELNDHGTWNWTANAATGAVQFSIMTDRSRTILQESLPDNLEPVVQLN